MKKPVKRHMIRFPAYFTIAMLLTAIPQVFGSTSILSWTDCVRIGLSNNLQLKQSHESVIQSGAERLTALSAYIPQLSASAGYNLTKTGDSATYYNSSLGLNARQLVFDGLATPYGIHRSMILEQAAKMNYKLSSATVRQNIRTSFAGLIKAYKNIELTRYILTLRTEQYTSVKLRYMAGQENNGSVLSSEADVAQARFELEQAERNLPLAAQQLGFNLGITNHMLAVTNTLNFTRPSSNNGYLTDLAKINPNVQYYSLQVSAAMDSLKIAYALLYPSVSLNGGAGLGGSSFPPDQPQLSFGISLSLPFLQGGSVLAKIKSAKSSLEATRQKYLEEQRNILLGLKQAWESFYDSFTTLDIQKKYLKAAIESGTIADQQYATGLITFNEWIIIRNNLVNSEKNVLNAEVQVMLNEASWISAQGGTLEDEK
jgi:outer membrane protein